MSNSFSISVAPEIAALSTKVDTIDTVVDAIRAVDVGAIQANINANETKIDANKGVIDANAVILARSVKTMEFWSTIEGMYMTIDDGISDKNLSNVNVVGIPSGSSIIRVVAIFSCTVIANSYAGVNYFKQSSPLRVKKSTGAWDTDDINAILFDEFDFQMEEASTIIGGCHVVGNINISSVVDENALYNFQLEDSRASHDYMDFHGCTTGLKVWFI